MLSGLTGDRVLLADGTIAPATLRFEGDYIDKIDTSASVGTLWIDDYLVLPGIVDIHGDAFERQISPRPEVSFEIALALEDTDRQLLANGISTALHGITWSWEGGLRGRENADRLIAAIRQPRQPLGADHRVHLRFETYNVDALDEVEQWLISGRVDFLAFNDHMPMVTERLHDDGKLLKYADRAGLSLTAFRELTRRTAARTDEVEQGIDRLAAVAAQRGIAMASHDDYTREERLKAQKRGIHICEFPRTRAAADMAHELGNPIVLGAPNVVLGGSHCKAVDARTMVAADRCDILASDYFYPSMLQAAFRLMREEIVDFSEAWARVSLNPALAAGLFDRGSLEEGKRADLIIVDDRDPWLPRVVATVVGGRLRFSNMDLQRVQA